MDVEMELQPKMKFIVGGLLGVLAVIIVLLLLLSKTKLPFTTYNKTLNLNETGTIKKPSLTNIQIAEKAISWLDSIKDKQNIYYFGQQCRLNKSCDTPFTDKQIGIPVIWARYQYYKKTRKPEELQIIKEHISSYLSISFQPDFWHCKLLYEMSQDDAFTQGEKNNLKTLCTNTAFYQIASAAAEKKNPNTFNSSDIINKLESKSSSIIISDSLPKNEREFLMYCAYTSDLISISSWFQSPTNLEGAKYYFDNAIYYYIQKKNSTSSYLPFLGIAALDMYKATNNKQYLEFATYLANKIEKENPNNTVYLAGLAYLENSLYASTNDKNYSTNFKKNVAKIVDNSFDYSGYQGFRIGKGAFHNQEKDEFYYDTRNVALIINLLMHNEN